MVSVLHLWSDLVVGLGDGLGQLNSCRIIAEGAKGFYVGHFRGERNCSSAAVLVALDGIQLPGFGQTFAVSGNQICARTPDDKVLTLLFFGYGSILNQHEDFL
jgi:hypothetical protein